MHADEADVVVIQSLWRAKQARAQVREARGRRDADSVSRVQALWRAKLARRQVAQMRKEVVKEKALERKRMKERQQANSKGVHRPAATVTEGTGRRAQPASDAGASASRGRINVDSYLSSYSMSFK